MWDAEGAARRLHRDAVEELGPFLAGVIRPEYFLTLTWDRTALRGLYRFRQRGWGATDDQAVVTVDVARREGERFFSDLASALGRPFGGVLATDAHVTDSQHLHGTLNVGGADDFDVIRGVWMGRPGHGMAWVERPRSAEHVTAYCSKYLLKAEGELIFSPGFDAQLALLKGERRPGANRRRLRRGQRGKGP